MVLRQRLMEQMESRMQVEDEELRDLIRRSHVGARLPLDDLPARRALPPAVR